VFVDYNAWEFNRTDELWAGMIRSIYDKVELRMENHRNTSGDTSVDYKLQWRVEKAKKLLTARYGRFLRGYLLALACFIIGLVATVVLSSIDVIPL
jgi:hypothetical protein